MVTLRLVNAAVLCVLCWIILPAAYGEEEPASPAPWRVRGTADDHVVDQPLVFDGGPGVRFRCPGIQQFRLHRLSAPAARVPLVFHWEANAFDFAEDVLIDKVRLTLNDVRWHTRGRRQRRRGADHLLRGEVLFPLDALAPLAPGGRYRLDWTYQVEGADEAVTSSCEFTMSKTTPEGIFRWRPAPPSPPVAHYYYCDALFRRDDQLFLSCGIVPHRNPADHGLPIVGFNRDNEPVDPPDGFRPIRRIRSRGEAYATRVPTKSKPPLAFASGYIHVDLERKNERNCIHVAVSDLATGADPPTKVGEATYAFFSGVIYRIERIERNVERLREDPEFWAQRTTELIAELRGRRDVVIQSRRDLPCAIYVLRDPVWTQAGIDRLDALSATVIDNHDTVRFPSNLVRALAGTGDARTVAAFRRLLDAHPQFGYRLEDAAVRLIDRVEFDEARPLLFSLLHNNAPVWQSTHMQRLRDHDPTIPARVQADQTMVGLSRSLKVSPATFGMRMIEETLLSASLTPELTEQQRSQIQAHARGGGTWYMPTDEVRRAAAAAIMERFRHRETNQRADEASGG